MLSFRESAPRRLLQVLLTLRGTLALGGNWRNSMPRNAALLGIVMLFVPVACTTVACTTVVRPGLANAPALSGTPVDARAHDVIANGGDSCERRLGPGPLRNEVPPCATVGPSSSNPTVAIQPPSERSLLWVEHYYTDWPCSARGAPVRRITLAGSFASPSIAFDRELRGATCPADWGERR
jgi:hypothetical protein